MRKILVIVVLLFLAVVGFVLSPDDKKRTSQTMVMWDYDLERSEWAASGTPPECLPLELESPVDVSKVTSVLYPGQYRGEDGNYRAHGGFRFDRQKTTDVEVRAPFDGYVWRGSGYLVKGEIQYVFDIVNSCGIMYRLGHLLELSPQLQKLADKFPAPKEGDSRDHRTENVAIKKGDLIGTKVGLPGNVFLDWGVYDLRRENEASEGPAYRQEHQWQAQFVFHALCWLDYLPSNQQTILKNLPGGDLKVGKQSDYCS